MQVWMNLVLVLQVVAAIVMIGLVLVQQGKGADMGASFGSGASGSLFGATGSANFLSRSTAVCASVFFVTTLALAFMTNSATMLAPSSGGSVLDRAASAASAATPTGAIPVAASGVAPLAAPSATPSATPAAAAVAASAAPAAPGTIPTK